MLVWRLSPWEVSDKERSMIMFEAPDGSWFRPHEEGVESNPG